MVQEAAAEAYQRLFHIVKQTGPGGNGGFLPRDKHVVGSADAQGGQKRPGGLAEAAASPVADNGSADLLCRGKSRAGFRPGRPAAAGLDDDQAPSFGVTLCHKKKFTPHLEADDLKRRRVG